MTESKEQNEEGRKERKTGRKDEKKRRGEERNKRTVNGKCFGRSTLPQFRLSQQELHPRQEFGEGRGEREGDQSLDDFRELEEEGVVREFFEEGGETSGELIQRLAINKESGYEQ